MATPYYFSEDGSWGLAEDIVLVDEEEVDEHLFQMADFCYDSNRAKFAQWFKDNDHEAEPTDDTDGFSNGHCAVCDKWER